VSRNSLFIDLWLIEFPILALGLVDSNNHSTPPIPSHPSPIQQSNVPSPPHTNHGESESDSDLEAGDMPEFILPPMNIEDLSVTQEFIHLLQTTTLDDGSLSSEVLHCLQHPLQTIATIESPNIELSICQWLDAGVVSEELYEKS
jgi:hypothetical protein